MTATDPGVTITCDPTPVSDALRATVPAIAPRTEDVDHGTADRVAGDVRSRVPRLTGETESTTVVQAMRAGGYAVIIKGAARYLEFGTKFMQARTFFFPAVTLESPGYHRRTRDAVQDGIDQVGLGT